MQEGPPGIDSVPVRLTLAKYLDKREKVMLALFNTEGEYIESIKVWSHRYA
jgi:hypothetical protein